MLKIYASVIWLLTLLSFGFNQVSCFMIALTLPSDL
jgi:hypothetical protein